MQNKVAIKKVVFHITLLLSVFGTANHVYGVQQHGGAEGLVSHQLGHLLFLAGMLTLLIWVCYLNLRGPGWLEFRGFLWFIILWNCLTFAGHWLREVIDLQNFVMADADIVSFEVDDFYSLIFYLSRLDHLLLVPALLLLLRALVIWRRS